MKSEDVVRVVVRLDAAEVLEVGAVVGVGPVGEVRVREVWKDAARSMWMDQRPRPNKPVAGGVSFVRRCICVEDDSVLEQEALMAVSERGRADAAAVVRAAPRREVELAGVPRNSPRREGVDQLGDRLGR